MSNDYNDIDAVLSFANDAHNQRMQEEAERQRLLEQQKESQKRAHEDKIFSMADRAIKDEILPLEDVCLFGLKYCTEHYPHYLENRFEIELSDDVIENLRRIARKRNCLKPANELDEENKKDEKDRSAEKIKKLENTIAEISALKSNVQKYRGGIG